MLDKDFTNCRTRSSWSRRYLSWIQPDLDTYLPRTPWYADLCLAKQGTPYNGAVGQFDLTDWADFNVEKPWPSVGRFDSWWEVTSKHESAKLTCTWIQWILILKNEAFTWEDLDILNGVTLAGETTNLGAFSSPETFGASASLLSWKPGL